MEERKILDYIYQVFTTYGIIVAIFLILGKTIGNGAGPVSSLYSYGDEAFSIATLAQLLLVAVIVVAAQFVFISDKVIKSMSMLVRNVLFFLVVIVCLVVMIIAFGWFSVNSLLGWVSFLVCFSVCSVLGIIASYKKEQAENRKMEKALEKLQNR